MPKTRFFCRTREELREAFLWEADRKVDKTGCFKLEGRIYGAGPEMAGKKVEARYDPFALEEVEIWREGEKVRTVKELVLNQLREAPTAKAAESPGRSRYLDVLEQKAKERRQKKLGAISFRDLGGDGRV